MAAKKKTAKTKPMLDENTLAENVIRAIVAAHHGGVTLPTLIHAFLSATSATSPNARINIKVR